MRKIFFCGVIQQKQISLIFGILYNCYDAQFGPTIDPCELAKRFRSAVSLQKIKVRPVKQRGDACHDATQLFFLDAKSFENQDQKSVGISFYLNILLYILVIVVSTIYKCILLRIYLLRLSCLMQHFFPSYIVVH